MIRAKHDPNYYLLALEFVLKNHDTGEQIVKSTENKVVTTNTEFDWLDY